MTLVHVPFILLELVVLGLLLTDVFSLPTYGRLKFGKYNAFLLRKSQPLS